MSSQLPSVRSEFVSTTTVGRINGLRRYEVLPPAVTGEIRVISEAFGCTHARRASVIARVGGGHLRAPLEELLHRLLEEARSRLDTTCARKPNASEAISELVSWLEREQESGFLEYAYITAAIILAVSDDEVWTWLVSPHGLMHGTADQVSAISTDLRYPVLRGLGLMKPPAYEFSGADFRERASSIMCIGAPIGYESIRTRLARSELVVALDRGMLPYGPLPTEPVPVRRLWEMDAAWKHGLNGAAIAFGATPPDALGLPEGWQIKEIPLHE